MYQFWQALSFLYISKRMYEYLEGPEEADAAQDGHPQRRHQVGHGEHQLHDGGDHHKEVKPVEERDEVELDAKGVHLEEHLEGEEDHEEEVGCFLETGLPVPGNINRLRWKHILHRVGIKFGLL